MRTLMDIVGEAGNLHYAKRYKESIELLDKYFNSVKDRETLAQFHVEYAINYEKLKDVEKCNYHCEEAVQLYHDANYAYMRLIINYVKAKDWENALRICDTILERKSFFLKQPGGKNLWESLSSYAKKRKEFILKKMD
jgi:tetratricopeptide (TPR) repeat protein